MIGPDLEVLFVHDILPRRREVPAEPGEVHRPPRNALARQPMDTERRRSRGRPNTARVTEQSGAVTIFDYSIASAISNLHCPLGHLTGRREHQTLMLSACAVICRHEYTVRP